MSKIYFISDVHLGFKLDEGERLKREKLRAFLEYIQKDARELYILGDFFDFWFEWRLVIPKYWSESLFQLKRLADNGTGIHLIKGNHDFYHGEYLEGEMGLHCHGDSLEFSSNGKRFFIAHGDGLARSDRGYRLLKRIIRNSLSIYLFRNLIPANLGIQIAKWTSMSSRRVMSKKKMSWEEEYHDFAKAKFQQGFDYVILGHLHIPQIRESNGKTYINCGDWIRSFSYACFDQKSLTLNRWDTP